MQWCLKKTQKIVLLAVEEFFKMIIITNTFIVNKNHWEIRQRDIMVLYKIVVIMIMIKNKLNLFHLIKYLNRPYKIESSNI